MIAQLNSTCEFAHHSKLLLWTAALALTGFALSFFAEAGPPGLERAEVPLAAPLAEAPALARLA